LKPRKLFVTFIIALIIGIFFLISCNAIKNREVEKLSFPVGTQSLPIATLPFTISISPTASYTPTSTSTITPTPTPTSTLTPTPTPIGGGLLQLAFIGKDNADNYFLYIGNLELNEYSALTAISYEDPSWFGPLGRNGNISLAWSPDGSKILFNTGSIKSDRLRLIDVKSGGITELFEIPNGSWVGRISWLPDNNSLVAFEVTEVRGSSIIPSLWIADVSNAKVHQVSKSRNPAYDWNWSLDGKMLHYGSGGNYMHYDPITESENELDVPRPKRLGNRDSGTRYTSSSGPRYIPEIDVFLYLMGSVSFIQEKRAAS
jgi:hypothetical protein